MSDIEVDEEQVARIRALWFPGGKASKPALAPHETEIARKLIGQDNAERLANHRPGDRAFRPAPVVVKFEYYFFDASSNWNVHKGWRINRLENGRSSVHKEFDTEALCVAEVKALRNAGYSVLPFKTDSAPPSSRKPAAPSRRAILETLKGFKA